MKKNTLLLLLVLLAASVHAGTDKLKVVCASRADTAPVIDGKLDDACWQQTEVCGDFTTIGDIAPVSQKTTMRWVYDDKNLYLALEFHWDDFESLTKGVAQIIAKHGADQKQPCKFKDFVNYYGTELFIDRGATRKNYYQILFNPAGQLCGHYNNIWEKYTGQGQYFKSTLKDGCWTAEFVFPAAGLQPGDKWGLNLVRNKETGPYAIWKQTGGAFNQPAMFGTMIIGSYTQWWDAVWSQGAAKQLDAIGKNLPKYAEKRSCLPALYQAVREEAARMDLAARGTRLADRDDFERRYEAYNLFQKKFSRLVSLYEAYQMTANPERDHAQ